MNSRGWILWFTGLSGAGKSTLASAVAPHVAELTGRRVEMLDGDVVRTHLSKGLGFSREDRDTNVRRIGWVADLVARHGGVAIVSAISPYRSVREELKSSYPNFLEIFVDAPVEACARRDVKGLYAKAMAGQIEAFTGVSDPYEEPLSPDVHVRTDESNIDACVAEILRVFRSKLA